MQSEELKRKSIAFDDMSPDESIGAFGGSGQWVELCTVRDLRALEAALSAPSVAVSQTLIDLAAAVLAQAPTTATEFMNICLDDIRFAISGHADTLPDVGNWTDDKRAKAWRRAFDTMHRRAMKAEAALSAQVQDVSGLESNPITLRWWCQQLLDIIESYDINHAGCDEEIALINDIRSSVDPAAPAKQEG